MNCTLLLTVPILAMLSSQSLNVAAMSDRMNRDGVALDREQHAPISGAQPHSGDALERFHIANARFRERRQFDVDLRARNNGKLAPLADRGRSKRDFSHT